MKDKDLAKGFTINKFGLVALTIIFLLLYGYFSAFNSPLKTPVSNDHSTLLADNSIVLGNLGGFHLLEDISYSDERTYHRIAIHTRLNRSTIIDETIITPYTKIQQVLATKKTFIDGNYQDTTNLGDYRIQITLSDTRTFDLSQDPITEVFSNKKISINKNPITEIHTIKVPDDSTIQILIGLTKKVRLHISNDNTGIIFVDILK